MPLFFSCFLFSYLNIFCCFQKNHKIWNSYRLEGVLLIYFKMWALNHKHVISPDKGFTTYLMFKYEINHNHFGPFPGIFFPTLCPFWRRNHPSLSLPAQYVKYHSNHRKMWYNTPWQSMGCDTIVALEGRWKSRCNNSVNFYPLTQNNWNEQWGNNWNEQWGGLKRRPHRTSSSRGNNERSGWGEGQEQLLGKNDHCIVLVSIRTFYALHTYIHTYPKRPNSKLVWLSWLGKFWKPFINEYSM